MRLRFGVLLHSGPQGSKVDFDAAYADYLIARRLIVVQRPIPAYPQPDEGNRMYGLHPVDLAVIVVYLVGVTFLGVWSGRFIKNIGDFFMPRRFGKAFMITHAFGTGTASDQAVLVAAQTYSQGVSGIWWQWLWLPITPFYWLIAPIMRRLRAVTTADVYELRFDRSVAVLFAIVGIVGLSVKIGLMLEGASALIHSSSGGMINSNIAVIVVTAMFVTYGMAGGLSAAIITDFFQGLLTVVFSFLLLPFVLHDVGGLSGVRETIRDPKMLSLVVPGAIGPFFIVMFALQALIGIVAQPFIMGVCSAGRTEMDGRVGFMFGNIVKRICTIAWSLTGLAAVAWYIQNGVDTSGMEPDHVYGNIAREFFPTLGRGPARAVCRIAAGGRDELLRFVHDRFLGPVYEKYLPAAVAR